MTQNREETTSFESLDINGIRVEYRIHSIMHVATADIQATNLSEMVGFSENIGGAQYQVKDSNAKIVIGSQQSPRRLMIYGSQSSSEANEYINELVEKLQSLGIQAELVDSIEVANLAVSGGISVELDLGEITHKLQKDGIEVEYEPEQFPALVLKLDKYNATFLLYSTGSFVLQGIKEPGEISEAIREMMVQIFRD